MIIGQITSGQVATSVWSNATRTLTADQMQELTDEAPSFLTLTTPAAQDSFSGYTQVIASTSHTVRAVVLCGTANAAIGEEIRIAVGPAASEVDKLAIMHLFATATTTVLEVRYSDGTLIGKGVRVSARIRNRSNASAQTWTGFINLIEAND